MNDELRQCRVNKTELKGIGRRELALTAAELAFTSEACLQSKDGKAGRANDTIQVQPRRKQVK